MQKTKEYEIKRGLEYTDPSPASFDSMPGDSVKNYTFFFICNACKSKFPLAELAKKR